MMMIIPPGDGQWSSRGRHEGGGGGELPPTSYATAEHFVGKFGFSSGEMC